jgi:hypothetical protein
MSILHSVLSYITLNNLLVACALLAAFSAAHTEYILPSKLPIKSSNVLANCISQAELLTASHNDFLESAVRVFLYLFHAESTHFLNIPIILLSHHLYQVCTSSFNALKNCSIVVALGFLPTHIVASQMFCILSHKFTVLVTLPALFVSTLENKLSLSKLDISNLPFLKLICGTLLASHFHFH